MSYVMPLVRSWWFARRRAAPQARYPPATPSQRRTFPKPLTTQDHTMYCPKRILVGVDYGAQSVKATSTAIELAKALGASVHLLNAWTAPYAEIPIDALSLPRDVRDHNLLELVRQSSATSMQAFI